MCELLIFTNTVLRSYNKYFSDQESAVSHSSLSSNSTPIDNLKKSNLKL